MPDISQIRAIAADKYRIVVTAHAEMQMRIRKISIQDIYSAIGNGETIKQYPDDKPYPSCLVLGFTSQNKPLHFVCSIGNNTLYLITAYYPDEEQWDDSFKFKTR